MPQMRQAERLEKMARALDLHCEGWTDIRIAEALSVTRQTAKKLREDELANRAEHRTGDREKAIALYEKVIAEGWQRLSRMPDRSQNVTGILNTIRGAQDSINKITGAEAPIKFRDESEESYDIVFDDEESFGIVED